MIFCYHFGSLLDIKIDMLLFVKKNIISAKIHGTILLLIGHEIS